METLVSKLTFNAHQIPIYKFCTLNYFPKFFIKSFHLHVPGTHDIVLWFLILHHQWLLLIHQLYSHESGIEYYSNTAKEIRQLFKFYTYKHLLEF